MHSLRRSTAHLSTAGVLLALLAGPVAVATTAGPALAMCESNSGLSVHATNVRMPFRNIPVWKDGRGGQLEVSRSYSSSVSASVTVGAEAEIDAVFEKAKVSISASIEKTNSTSSTHTYSHHISAGKFGHAQYVSWGKRVRWDRWHTYTKTGGGCGVMIDKSGVIRFPTSSEGWYYWETSS